MYKSDKSVMHIHTPSVSVPCMYKSVWQYPYTVECFSSPVKPANVYTAILFRRVPTHCRGRTVTIIVSVFAVFLVFYFSSSEYACILQVSIIELCA